MNTIPLDKLEIKSNVRSGSKRNTTEYKNLKQSISAIGILTPITVHENGSDKYVIIDGHQRFSVAKDLKLNDIPVYVKETANTSTEQVSANMFNIPMTLLEASDVIANLMEENPDYTRKNIADLFGRKVDWVDKAISLTNLSPEIRKVVKDPVKVMDDLVKISAFSLELQKKAFEFSDLDENEEGVAWELDSIYRKLSYSNNTDVYTELIPVETFRKYEKEMDRTNTYANNLFAEYDDGVVCTDDDFLQAVFLNETAVGQEIFNELPIITDETEYQNHDYFRMMYRIWASKQSFYKHFKWTTGYKYSEVDLVAWDGDVETPNLYYNLKKKSSKTDEAIHSKDKTNKVAAFKRQANKFAKVFLPEYYTYLLTQVNREYTVNDMNVCLSWLAERGPLSISRNDTLMTNTDVINALVDENYGMKLSWATWEGIDKLAGMTNLQLSEGFFKERFASDKDFRESIYNCFTIATLQKIAGDNNAKNKKDLVGYLAESTDKFSKFKQIKSKFTYDAIKELADIV